MSQEKAVATGEGADALVPQTMNAPPAPSQILALAVQRDADPALIEKMMDLQERWEANEAKKLFVRSMAAFKQRAPAVLGRDGEVDFTSNKGRTHYRYTTLGSVVIKITALLGEHGLSVSWGTNQESGQITVSCHITHEAGHSESVTLSAPPDNSGNKNAIQQVGSTVTYLQRYTLLAALGLATGDQDDDGAVANGGSVTMHVNEQQREKIAELCRGLGIVKEDWFPDRLGLFPAGIKRVRDMSEAQAAELIARLSQAKTKDDLMASAAPPDVDPLLTPEQGKGDEPAENVEPETEAPGPAETAPGPPHAEVGPQQLREIDRLMGVLRLTEADCGPGRLNMWPAGVAGPANLTAAEAATVIERLLARKALTDEIEALLEPLGLPEERAAVKAAGISEGWQKAPMKKLDALKHKAVEMRDAKE